MDPRTGITLAYIPAGRFEMGSPAGERGRDLGETLREVTLSHPFWMGSTEVTNGQYRRFVEATGHRAPMYWERESCQGPTTPVVGVSWTDASAYAQWAGMSLPTEAQWEYAARAGTQTAYWSGDGEDDLAAVGWFRGNSSEPRPVGEKPANPWGLHDIHGNAYEWTADWDGTAAPASAPSTDPRGPSSGPGRIFRGGCWSTGASSARAAYREYAPADYFSVVIGFRVAKSAP